MCTEYTNMVKHHLCNCADSLTVSACLSHRDKDGCDNYLNTFPDNDPDFFSFNVYTLLFHMLQELAITVHNVDVFRPSDV